MNYKRIKSLKDTRKEIKSANRRTDNSMGKIMG